MENKFEKLKYDIDVLWNYMFHKKHSIFVSSGTYALFKALKLLKSKIVALPSYTCKELLNATLMAECKFDIIDCGDDLQIDIDKLSKSKADTVIVPHMFGIQADIKLIKELNKFLIIEDCSQCLGVAGLGKYSDITMTSVGATKWLPAGYGGIVSHNLDIEILTFIEHIPMMKKTIKLIPTIGDRLILRTKFANELINAGVPLIQNNKENAWFKGMYLSEKQHRQHYIPLHEMVNDFKCPNVDSFKNKVDWISIFPR